MIKRARSFNGIFSLFAWETVWSIVQENIQLDNLEAIINNTYESLNENLIALQYRI